MNTNSLANTLKSLNPTKQKRPSALLIIVLIALNIFAAVSLAQAQIATSTTVTPALHAQGTYILDNDGNTIYLRGMGLAGFVPNLILWGPGATDGWNNQWNYNPTAVMEQTFKTMKEQWHINYIRVFIYPSWYYRDSITPAQVDPAHYGTQTTPISTKAYLHTLIQTADKYGIYVNIVPYMLTPSASSFAGDPYASQGHGWQGLPLEGWDEPARRFLTDAGYNNRELEFWRWFWTDMANTYKNYNNVIFEAWNEPNLGIDNDPIPTGYMNYLKTMYSAIRTTGATNLIMMQWHMGWHPNTWGNDLSWAKQIATAIPDATNLVYTTHLYYYAPTDLTEYWKTDYQGLKTQLSDAVKTMGITAPLVINEQGSCIAKTTNIQNDLTWWANLLRAQHDLGIGAGAYYWLSDTGLGHIYAGETMLTRGYTPNAMGQAYINEYKPQTQTTTATQQTSVSTSITETPTQSTPTPTPSVSPRQTQPSVPSMRSIFPQQTQIETQPTPNEDIKPVPSPTPTPSPSAPLEPLENPIQSIIWGYFYRNWFIFYWPQQESWFIFRW